MHAERGNVQARIAALQSSALAMKISALKSARRALSCGASLEKIREVTKSLWGVLLEKNLPNWGGNADGIVDCARECDWLEYTVT